MVACPYTVTPTQGDPWARSRTGPGPGEGQEIVGGNQNLGHRGEAAEAEKEEGGENSWASP